MSKSLTCVDRQARNSQVKDLQIELHRVTDAREQNSVYKSSTRGTSRE